MKDEAIMRLHKEAGAYNGKGNKYGKAMAPYIMEKLIAFCEQQEEFAQAVVQGGDFAGCMAAVAKKVKGESISDLDACRAAAEYYFPGCVVEFHMEIRMSKYETEEKSAMGMVLNLEDFL